LHIFGGQCSGWAKAEAGATEGTTRFFKTPFMDGGRAGVKAAHIVVNSANLHQFVIRTDTLAAEDALAQVPDHEGIGFLEGLGVGHGVEIGFADSQIGCSLAQLAPVSLGADDTRLRVLGNHQTHNIVAMLDDASGSGLDLHTGGRRGYTGGHEPPAFIFHQAHAARAIWLEIGMITKSGDLDIILVSRFKQAAAGGTGNLITVDGQRYGFQWIDSLRFAELSR
jgi:hypothetical protein